MVSTRISYIKGDQGPTGATGPTGGTGPAGPNTIPTADFLGTEMLRAGSPLEEASSAKINAPGSANNPHTSASATRNSAITVNHYRTATAPTTSLPGDEWLKVSA